MIAPEVRERVVAVVGVCDDLARVAMALRRELIDDDEGLGWVLRLQDRMAAVRIEAATLLDEHEPPAWLSPRAAEITRLVDRNGGW